MKKILVVLFTLAICATAYGEEKKVDGQGKIEKEKPDTRSVIVDAWLLRVDADALYQSGVRPLSEKEKENVSVMNLLWCLSEPNSGEVMFSTRTRTLINQRVESRSETTEYIKNITTTKLPNMNDVQRSVSYMPFSSKVEFRNRPWVIEDKNIWIEYEFSSKKFILTQDTNSPPNEIYVNFRNTTVVPKQKSSIVEQSQIGNDMFFLVMKAEIVE